WAIGSAVAECLDDRSELLLLHGKRLLDIDGLTRLEGLPRVLGVAIMSGCDRDSVDLRITEDFCSVSGCIAESVALCKRLCVHSPSGADRHGTQVLKRGKMREQHRFGIVSSSDHSKPDRLKGGIAR